MSTDSEREHSIFVHSKVRPVNATVHHNQAYFCQRPSSTPSSTPYASLTFRRRWLRCRRLLRLGEGDSTLWAAGQSAFHIRATRVAAATAIAASLMTWAPDSGGSCTGAGADGEGATGGEGGGGARQTNRGPGGGLFLLLFSSSAASAASSYENAKSPSCVASCSGEADGGAMASAAGGGATRGS